MEQRIAIPVFTESQTRNFWAKVEPTGFCWNWTAAKTYDGYGRFNVNRTGKQVLAHRASYVLLVGKFPIELDLDHLCRNPSCVNPDHLEPVTTAENNSRVPEPLRMRPGSMPSWVVSGKDITGTCSRGHEYTEANTYYYKDGRTDCRTCRRINRQAYKAKVAALRSDKGKHVESEVA